MAGGLYVDQRTAFHRMHPVSKVLCLVLWFSMSMIFTHPLYLMGIGLIALAVACWVGAMENVWHVRWFMFILFLLSAGMWAVFREGRTVLFELGPLRVSWEAVVFGMGMGVRLNLMLLCGLIFLTTTTVEDFAAGLCGLGLPYSVGFAFGLAFRLVPMFMESAQTILQAQQCRGLDTQSGGLIRRTRSYIPLIVPVFMTAVRNADNLAMALESKGFGAKRERTTYIVHTVGAWDAAAIALSAVLMAACVYLRLSGYGCA